MRVGATDIGAATVSVRQRSVRPLLARPLLALVRTAVTATTLMATGFAATNPSSLALGARPASISRSTPVRDANWVTVMTLVELERMSADDLWKLHVEIGEALAARLTAEKDVLEERLKSSQPNRMPNGALPLRSAVRIQQSFRSFAIPTILRRPGLGAASSHAG